MIGKISHNPYTHPIWIYQNSKIKKSQLLPIGSSISDERNSSYPISWNSFLRRISIRASATWIIRCWRVGESIRAGSRKSHFWVADTSSQASFGHLLLGISISQNMTSSSVRVVRNPSKLPWGVACISREENVMQGSSLRSRNRWFSVIVILPFVTTGVTMNSIWICLNSVSSIRWYDTVFAN